MPKGRGNGEGSIYQTKDGRWRAEVSLGYKPDGKPRRKIVYAKTRAEVAAELTDLLKQKNDGLEIKPGKLTLGEFLTDWLENTVKLENRYQTWRSYEWLTRVHIIPAIGKHPLHQVNRRLLQGLIKDKVGAGLSPTTIRHMNATLKSALSVAVKEGTLTVNPARLTALPRVQRFQPAVLTPAHATSLLKFLVGHQHESLYVTALTMGLRRGELMALRWADIDLEEGQLSVRHSLYRVKGNGLHVGEPKSEKAKRKLRIPQVCLLALARGKVLQEQQRRWAGSKWKDADFVFTNGTGGPLHPDDVSREFPQLLQTAGLPKARLHDARHCCATLLLSMGVHAKMVQETLGHSSYQITMDLYTHALPQLRDEVADCMDQLFLPARPDPTSAPTKEHSEAVN